MKNSVCSGVSALMIAALVLPGCGSNDGGAHKDGSGEGSNTGNGSCVAPWCSFPPVLTGDDGKIYRGVLGILAGPTPAFGFTGHQAIDSGAGCSLQPGISDIQIGAALSPATIDESGRMHFRQKEDQISVEADLTLTNELDLSGRITVLFTTDVNNSTVLASPGENPGHETWTSAFTVQAKTSVSCAPGQTSIAIPLSESPTAVTQLACKTQPDPPSYVPCNDQTPPPP